jgi:hypothetical protein
MDKMTEICRRFASAINSLLGLLGSVFLLVLLWLCSGTTTTSSAG